MIKLANSHLQPVKVQVNVVVSLHGKEKKEIQ